MHVTAAEARLFLPLVLPLCLIAAYTDLRALRIRNWTVVALAAVFVFLGPLALPWPDYGVRLAQLALVLVLGFILNAGGALGAGDAKFAAAAAPFIAPGDMRLLLAILAANLLAAIATHRLARATPLRRLAPGWQSWGSGQSFPMGLSLGGTLALYLGLGAVLGR
ncbi:prepilin peptidase [Pukyongiella litopenaei]|uniref:prepilin peptidase n=1 Tax=Pukyongiella litopenaei TaxID=2605946 RepID=UPI001FCE4A79|nr:prepilin peptidase [Pukyongiella litopenaei]